MMFHPTCSLCGRAWETFHQCPPPDAGTVQIPTNPTCKRCLHPLAAHIIDNDGLWCPLPRWQYEAP